MTYLTIRGLGLAAATTIAFTALTTLSHAYSPEQQQLCQDDAMRLCGEFIPDVDRITSCMVAKYSQLSDRCKTVFRQPSAPSTAVTYAPGTKPSKPLNITPNR